MTKLNSYLLVEPFQLDRDAITPEALGPRDNANARKVQLKDVTYYPRGPQVHVSPLQAQKV